MRTLTITELGSIDSISFTSTRLCPCGATIDNEEVRTFSSDDSCKQYIPESHEEWEELLEREMGRESNTALLPSGEEVKVELSGVTPAELAGLLPSLLKAPKLAQTHDGEFHADDVLAAATLRLALWGCKNIPITRSREIADDGEEIILFDVGSCKFDYLQKSGSGTHPEGVDRAASGVVWCAYGLDAVRSIIWHLTTSDAAVVYCWDVVRKELVLSVDAMYNDYSLIREETVGGVDIFSISAVISSFNAEDVFGKEQDHQFEEAVEFAKDLLSRLVKRAFRKFECKTVVEEAIARASNHIIILDEFVPGWREHVIYADPKWEILFCVYPFKGKYLVQAVPVEDTLVSFKYRKLLPTPWAGLRGEAAIEAAGPGVEVVHTGLLSMRCKTRESAIVAAIKAVVA